MADPIRALIDGDEVAFKAFTVSTDTVDWGDGGEAAPVFSLAKAVRTAEDLIKGWVEKVHADSVVVCLSCRDRDLFRKRLFPPYKGERTEKPQSFWDVVSSIEETFKTVEWPFLEADDVMGILSGDPGYRNVICSSDKDMKTIPGRLFDPYHGTKVVITPRQADHWWMYQTLIGDTTDGFKGCPKIGPKTAEKILSGCADLQQMWVSVVETYRSKELDGEYALTQARMARILRPGDYDQETNEIKLWHPTRVVTF